MLADLHNANKNLEQEIASYLDKEGIVSRTTDEMFGFLSHYESEESLIELKKVLDKGSRRFENKSLFYDAIARRINGIGFYDYLMGRDRTGIEWDIKKILGEIENPRNVLDVGCGTGLLSCLIALKYPQTQITGLELSHEMMERANERAKRHSLENIGFIKGDIDYGIADKKSYDHVICVHVPIKQHPQDLGHYFRRLSLEQVVSRPGKIIIIGREYPDEDHYTHETEEKNNVNKESTSKSQEFHFYGGDNFPLVHTFQSISFT